MSDFNFKDEFYAFASQLLKKKSGLSQAKIRTVISRFYYSAYHALIELIPEKDRNRILGEEAQHAVYSYLRMNKLLSKNMDKLALSLKNSRKNADYKPSGKYDEHDLDYCHSQYLKLISLINNKLSEEQKKAARV